MTQKMVYLASPYSSPDPALAQRRFEFIVKETGELLRRDQDLVVLSPIVHSHPIEQYNSDLTGWAFWRGQDYELIRRCDELWVCKMPGWKESVGVTAEVEFCREIGKPVRHHTPILPVTKDLYPTPKKPKLFIVGYARHGKDTAAEFLRREYGYTFESSSRFCMHKFVRHQLSLKYGLGYSDYEACFNDRINHREKWAEIITAYNADDPARLSREIFDEYDIYVGLRSRVELDAARELADLVLWVDRPGWEVESKSSNTLDPHDADVIISAVTIKGLHMKLKALFDLIDPLGGVEL